MKKLSNSEIEKLVRQKLEGESYSLIRSRLSNKGFSEEEIRSTIRQVDERVLRAEIEKKGRESAKSWYMIGLGLAVIGLILTIGSNAGWILTGISRWTVYTPFFIGLLVMLYGKRLQQKQPDPLDAGPGRIRKKRPFK